MCFEFAMGETVSLYGRKRKLMYGPELEDRSPTAEELAEEKQIDAEITKRMSERHDILVEFAIGKLTDTRENRKNRLNQIEKELGIAVTE